MSRSFIFRIVFFPLCLAGIAILPAGAFQPRHTSSPLDALAIPKPAVPSTPAQPVDGLGAADPLRAAWNSFSLDNGGWQIFLDHRSGLPLLAKGAGINWAPKETGALPLSDPANLERLEAAARAFLASHSILLGVWEGQLQLDLGASGPSDGGRLWWLVFRQVVGGVPVEGARFDFQLNAGNLVAFGATGWQVVNRSSTPVIDAPRARAALDAYLGPANAALLEERELPDLRFVPADPRGKDIGAWTGSSGQGLSPRLVWRFVFKETGASPTWVAEVDADNGQVIAFFDDTRYERVMGGIYPVSNDQDCPSGCEQPGFPLPFADISINGVPASPANDAGMYQCTTLGSTIRTTLSGPYIKVHDNCGVIQETSVCDDPIDFKQGTGTDCAVPPGTSQGNTHASRSGFYHLNRVMQKGRAWLPDNVWLARQLTDNVNINATCNAYWDGSVNFYKSGGGCRNTGEIAGVFVHEWGHGIDQNDGGGYDNPSEAYADIVAFLETRESCVGRGFFESGDCSGYGDACLNCTGIRDQDWNMHQSHTPANAAWVDAHCGGGGGPCGGEEHCEAYISAEAVWDLAVRDLPAIGLDPATSWQLAEKLFYVSRKGSGGNAYNCSGSTSDGCGANAWYHKFLVADDDDGNLANGTPHAAGIYAAFARHGIACGASTDPSNRNYSSCPVIETPLVGAIASTNAVIVDWTPVPGAASYKILRNELGCERAQIMIDKVAAPGASYTDDGLPNNLMFFYRVQAVGSNPACESAVSDCVSTAGQPFAGRARFDSMAYGCQDELTLYVKDGNVGSSKLAVKVASDTETEPETVVLTETPPGSQAYWGTFATTSSPAVHGDGKVSVSGGDVLTVSYRDADTGQGQPGISWASATVDCSGPSIGSVQVTGVTDGSATVSWTTGEPTTGRVDWGTTIALGNAVSDSQLSTSHQVIIQPFAECTTIYFRVVSTDAYGNIATLDAGGSPFRFSAQRIPGAIFKDDFESATAWTLEGEWQIGVPQGLGNPGDPTTGFASAKVLGHDLTGLGQYPGDYEPRVTERAITPVINAGSLIGGRLVFRRWLNLAGGMAFIDVKRGSSWNTVWQSEPTQGANESAWSYQSLDISAFADGNTSLQIAFRQFGGPNNLYIRSGWNVDRVVVKSGSVPDFEKCSACGGAPTFSGVNWVADLDPCADSGVELRWAPAPSWGTGTGGTYSIYRDTIPNFTPQASNRVATGLTGTSWIDNGAPNDVLVYYLVRAENNETCSNGPANHGMTDTNGVYLSIKPTTWRPMANAVTGLRAFLFNRANVRLTWVAPPGAAAYRVYRSTSPASGFISLDTTADPDFDDLGVSREGIDYYSVSSLDACGRETP